MAYRDHRVVLAIALFALLATGAYLLTVQARTRYAAPQVKPAERALENIRAHPAEANVGPGDTFTVRSVVADPDGGQHVHLDRLYRGLAVVGGDLVVHSRADGTFLGVSQTLRSKAAVPLRPSLSPAEAVIRALAPFPGVAPSERPKLVIDAIAAPRLAYEVVHVGTRPDGTPSEPHVLVDAHTGRVLHEFDTVESAVGRGFFNGRVALQTSTGGGGGYRLVDQSRGNSTTLDMRNRTSGGVVMASPTDAWGNGKLANRETVAVDVQFGGTATWDYFKRMFGRNGIAEDGVGPTSRVHFGRDFLNAFWSDACGCATFGDGDGTIRPLAALDVVAHELTHGVTAHAANFVDDGESAGLDESTSDIFGTMVEFSVASPRSPADYRIGERLFWRNPGNRLAIRYMWKPSLDWSSPDCWAPSVASLDPHAAAGIGNHFFYLLAEGSQPATGPRSPVCAGPALHGIGRDAAARIWYRALTVYLTSAANYAAARTATHQAAEDLFGKESGEAVAVDAAWAAVGVNAT